MARVFAAFALVFLLIGVSSAQQFKGCYIGDGDTAAADTSSSEMTNEDCAQFCGNLGKPYSGTGGEGRFCACLTTPDVMEELTPANAAECDYPCPGDPENTCGGDDNHVTVWSTGKGTKRTLSLREKLHSLRAAMEN